MAGRVYIFVNGPLCIGTGNGTFFGTCGLLHLICKPISSVLLPHRRRMPWFPAQAHPPGVFVSEWGCRGAK